MEATCNNGGKWTQSETESSIFVIHLEEDDKDKDQNRHMEQKTFCTLFAALMFILLVEVYLINSKIKQYLEQE